MIVTPAVPPLCTVDTQQHRGLTGHELRTKSALTFSSSECISQRRSRCSRCTSRSHFTASAVSTNTLGAHMVSVSVEKAARNTRHLYAGVDIAAPVEMVWAALTDYDGLGNFIPGLAENRCLQRRPNGAQLLQIGEQDIALGAKFRAKVILDIQEYSEGVPEAMCFRPGSSTASSSGRRVGLEGVFPEPRSLPGSKPQDIAFSMIEGDFAAFRGIWRMQPGQDGEASSRLSYSLHVQPQPWLPVRLIQGRIEGEIRVNLSAVRDHSERLWLAQCARQSAR